MKKLLLLLSALSIVLFSFAQKTVYIPLYLQDTTTNDGAQFTMSKTAQSTNFIIIWGNTVGTNPAQYTVDTTLRFDPAMILDTMEFIYSFYKRLGFLNDSPGTHLSQYKVPIIMYNTWGPNGATGYANGGDADGFIGAFWVHPIAMHDGGVAAHEFTHSLQSENSIDYRTAHGLGSVWDNTGIFWETHANFMRNNIYPKDVSAWGMDQDHIELWGDWKNTYENYELLMAIEESDGIDMVNRLWRDSYSSEYPLQAYKRLAGYSQTRFNDSMYCYARRMPTFDFRHNNVGNIFRSYRDQDFLYDILSIQCTYNILQKLPDAGHYAIPIEQAPEEYAYNIIPLYKQDSCAVIIKFKGHTDANSHGGWRYGFVSALADGTVSRYSDIYRDDVREISFMPNSNESKLYLVVMGAPLDSITTNPTNDTWHGYPKHFRFPYELNISGALPEGFQDSSLFRAQLKAAGHLHPNGGGWVDNTASVANTVYVGPYAMVTGASALTGSVQVRNTAFIKDATISSSVQVMDNAFVNGGILMDSAIVRGRAYVENDTIGGNAVINMRARVSNYTLSGNIEVGGDVVVYNSSGNCNNGVYYVMTNYYQDNLLQCDNRTATDSDNMDVNSTYAAYSSAQMMMTCNCNTLPACLTLGIGDVSITKGYFEVSPNPASSLITFHVTGDASFDDIAEITLYNTSGVTVAKIDPTQNNTAYTMDISGLSSGIYIARIKLSDGICHSQKIAILTDH